jgi:hypothetical protein
MTTFQIDTIPGSLEILIWRDFFWLSKQNVGTKSYTLQKNKFLLPTIILIKAIDSTFSG